MRRAAAWRRSPLVRVCSKKPANLAIDFFSNPRVECVVAHQAQSSTGSLAAPTDVAEAAGLLVHRAPQQRRGVCGGECGWSTDASDEISSIGRWTPSVRSGITSLKKDGGCAQSALDVTSPEQPVRSAPGAINAHARVVRQAPARASATCLDTENSVIQHHFETTSSDFRKPRKKVIVGRTRRARSLRGRMRGSSSRGRGVGERSAAIARR